MKTLLIAIPLSPEGENYYLQGELQAKTFVASFSG
jgi:hypothetical protein